MVAFHRLWLAAASAAVMMLFQPAAFASSARQIPVADDVDIVIAGGGAGAVAAAVEAARAGAKVFVAAPRTYLGEDIAGTMQLWLEPGEKPATPLARAVFSDAASIDEEGLPFTYKASLPANERHRDTKPPARLLGLHPITDPQNDSVQYDGDVTLTADLGVAQTVKEVQVVAFQHPGDYQLGGVRAETSPDGRRWTDAGSARCDSRNKLVIVPVPLGAQTRFVRLTVTRAPEAKRLLLGAIRFLPAAAAPQTRRAAAIRPMHVKTTLEEALRSAKVNYLFGCYATDLLVDQAGTPAGIVMANRSGRQAILAKVVIDATEHATGARLGGALFTAFAPGKQPVRWITIAGQAPSAADVSVRKLPLPVSVFNSGGELPTREAAFWFEHTLQLDLSDDSWPARARLEQTVRDKTYVPSQFYAADVPTMIPPCSIRAAKTGPADWPGAAALDLGVCRPAGLDRLWVLGGCADVPRECAEKMLRPVAMLELGARIGAAAAAEAGRTPRPEGVKVAPTTTAGGYAGDIREPLDGLRPLPAPARVPESARALPMLGRYDVVVVGGGTAGAAAGIGAARQGASTLVVEYLHGLGGVGTLGMIGKYWYGNRVGFAASVPQNPTEVRMEFLRHELRKAGAEIWFGSMGCGALVEGNRVTGVIVATPYGRGVVLARTVIDGTGNAEIAADAGAETRFVEDNFALQHSHLPPRQVGAYYINGDIAAVDVADPLDVREALQHRKARYFDRGQLVDSRERQHIVGDYCLDWLDQINRRTFPDSIAFAQSDYDSHGYQVHPYFMLRPARVASDRRRQYYSYLPYRCLLPRGVEGILVVGLGLSAHRDALPIVRMQPDLENAGYAAGVAGAMAAKAGTTPRQVNVKTLQQHLVEVGNLAASVPKQGDSFPLPKHEIAAAVRRVTRDYDGLEVLLAQPQDALPLLDVAYDAAGAADKLIYAHVLGVMGDARGADTLIAEAQRRLKEKDFQNPVAAPPPTRKGKAVLDDGSKAIPMDNVVRLIWALGGTGDRRGVPVLCALGEETPRANLQRYRAVVVSLGRLADPAAAPALAGWLKKKTGAGDVHELITACALYRCGDKDGLARAALERFVTSPNGPFSRLAWQVLNRHKSSP